MGPSNKQYQGYLILLIKSTYWWYYHSNCL